jgi:two-component system CheB/CheR fusion protein
MRARPTRGALYLVLFEAARRSAGRRSAPAERRTASPAAERRLDETQQLLQTVVQEQEATNQELLAANEEILSSNEELQSTNEELETAKEELQSTNEELTTVNDELSMRNQELSVLNDDLANFLASTHIPMAMLGPDLRIRRVTPAAQRLLNLIASDVGRPLTDVRARVAMPGLDRLVTQAIESMETRELDVRGEDGRAYAMRIRPYRTLDQRIDGVVVTWVDVADLRGGQIRTDDSAEAVIDGIPLPAAILGADLLVHAVNSAWRARWGDDPPSGKNLGPEWTEPDVEVALRRALDGAGPVELRAPLRGTPARVTARFLPGGGVPRVLLVVFPEGA